MQAQMQEQAIDEQPDQEEADSQSHPASQQVPAGQNIAEDLSTE